MFNEYDATVNDTTFQQNSASIQGGGLYNHTSDTLNLTGSRVEYNHAPSGEGGGIYNEGTVNLTNTLVRFNTVNNCSPAFSVTRLPGALSPAPAEHRPPQSWAASHGAVQDWLAAAGAGSRSAPGSGRGGRTRCRPGTCRTAG